MADSKNMEFLKKNGLWIGAGVLGILVLVAAWKPIKNFIQGLLSPVSLLGDVLKTPANVVNWLNNDQFKAMQSSMYDTVLQYVQTHNYDPTLEANFNQLIDGSGYITSDQKKYLLSVWKQPK